MATLTSGQDAQHWANVYIDSCFWQRWQKASPLENFKALVWREDLYQLGYMLADIRDGVGMASKLEGCTIQPSPVAAVNQLIEELPDQLKAWRYHVGSPAPAQPHQEYVRQIGKVLVAARQKGPDSHSSYGMRQSDYLSGQQSSKPEPTPHRTKPKPLVTKPSPPPPAAINASHITHPRTSSALELPVLHTVPADSFFIGCGLTANCQPLQAVQSFHWPAHRSLGSTTSRRKNCAGSYQ